jgi:hypothetical protein
VGDELLRWEKLWDDSWLVVLHRPLDGAWWAAIEDYSRKLRSVH